MFKNALNKKLQPIIRYFIHKNNKILYINDFTIKCLSPIDGNVSIEELLLRSRNTKAIKVNT